LTEGSIKKEEEVDEAASMGGVAYKDEIVHQEVEAMKD